MSTSPNLRSVVDDDGAVILNSSRNEMTTLDAMGGYVWRLLEQGMQLEYIVEHLARETRQDRAVIERDIHDFFADLATRNLIVRD